jgi:hypothetical protein
VKPAAGRNGFAALAVVLLLALVPGCGSDEKPATAPFDPGAPQGDLPPEIETVFPAARSTGVFYDTEIWMRFAEPLDPATVNESTVFFKLDTVRIPVTLTYDGATRTLRLAPRTLLALLRTYTVEITSGVGTAGGHPLSQAGFWQFRTNGLRRLENPTPAAGTAGESPFAFLRWGETETSAGSVVYRIHAGTDSAAIAARAPAPVRSGAEPYLVPTRPWPLGTRLYWAVTATNQTSGERLDGPVWSFETLPPGLPVDSLVVPAPEWGYYERTPNRVTCRGDYVFCGASYNDGIHWSLRETAAGLKLAGARVRVYGVSNNPVSGAPGLYPVKEPWAACAYGATTPKVELVKLADAVRIGLSTYAIFESDALTATLEAGARYDYVYGFSLRAGLNVGFLSPRYASDGPRLTLYYYRVPPAPGAAPGP